MHNKIKIAVKVNGGFGTVLVRANYIHCLWRYLGDHNVEIYVYAHKSKAVNDAVFKHQPGVFWYGDETQWKEIEKRKFAVVMILDIYPDIQYMDTKKIKENRALEELVKKWDRFEHDIGNELYYKKLRESKPYVYRKLIIEGKTILNSADIDGLLGIGGEYTMPVYIEKDEKQTLGEFHLTPQTYITIQRGINPKLGVQETPKMWPQSYYEALIQLLKKNYPDYEIVQLGESKEHCKTLAGVDIDLLGQTSWDDIKIILKHARLHIDGECGMVHLRKALHAGPSVVLFGPTPTELFGYFGNINLRGSGCSHWCAELRGDWEYRCLKGEEKAPCMYSLKPDFVFGMIDTYLHGDCSVLHQNPSQYPSGVITEEIIVKYREKLDEQYVKDWLSHDDIWGYELTEVCLKDLVCHVFDGNKWVWMPLKESLVYQYLNGNRKPYIDNMKIREERLENNIHSVARYDALIEELKDKTPEETKFIIVSCHNHIKDGQHRAAVWMKKYGEDASVPVLRIYRRETE